MKQSPFRLLISAVVALWLQDNPKAEGEKFIVGEHGEAVNVIIQRVVPKYDETKTETAHWVYN